MNAPLFLDSLFTVLVSMGLVGVGALTLWLLPWSDAERAGTARAVSAVARQAVDTAGRTRIPARVLAAR
jgi:hypothetical protein